MTRKSPLLSLLPLKHTIPSLRPGVLPRLDLQALLADVRLHAVTLLAAPAGYGKTTLLSQWAQDLARTQAPVIWLTLDGTDRDPVAFLSYLIGAFRAVLPNVGDDAWRLLSTATNLERDWPLVAGALCSDLQRKMPTATFLFLDDLQHIADSAVISQILGYLLRAAPLTLHVIIASRRMPTFAPLARLRAEGQLLEISQSDLHLSIDEVRGLLSAQGVALSDADLALLMGRTEGWALSVQLIARALATQMSSQRGPFLQALRGREEHLIDYLASEVLADLPREMIAFLRLAAMPSFFDANLLNAVLDRDDGEYLLSRAQALGLPLTPLDQHGDQVRFHPLWRELLLRSLPELMTHDQIMALHERFGHAFEQRGDLDRAFEHYAQAGATDELARALRECAWPLLRTPQRETIRRWIDHLPAELRESDPELLHMWGVSLGAVDAAQSSAMIERAIESYRSAGLHDRELRALCDLVALLGWQSRPADLMALCVRAIRAANHVRDPWSQGAARVCAAAMLFSKGRDVATLRVARQALLYPLSPTWYWLLAMITGTVCCRDGRPTEALTVIDEALQMQMVDCDDRMRQHLLRLRALALYQQGHTALAISLALEAHNHLKDYYSGSVIGISAMDLALLLLLQGRLDEATTYLVQARATFHRTGDLRQLANVQALEVYSSSVQGTVPHLDHVVTALIRRLQDTDSDESNLQLWLLMALVLGESGDHAHAHDVLATTIQQMDKRKYRLFLACAYLYRAYLAEQSGDTELQRGSLELGWTLMIAYDLRYLPMLPRAAIRSAVRGGLRQGVTAKTIGYLLQQLDSEAAELLQELLAERAPAVRAHAATLLGTLGSMAAYVPLRAVLKDRDAAVRRAAEDALASLVYRPPYTLRIRTLGSFVLWRGDEEVRDRDWRSSKARQLFQLLVTERGRTVPRERLLDTLWPELDVEAASNNLRVTLNRVSKAIEPGRPDGAPSSYITQQGDTFSFNMESAHQVDATSFSAAVNEAQLAERQGRRAKAISAYRQATAMYYGPYLPDALYEDWTAVERERLAHLFNDAALRLGALLLDEGYAHETIGLAWRVIEQDQTYEEAYQLLMRAHTSLGERSTALRLYDRCVQALQSELGMEPLNETTMLYQSIREMR